MEFPFGNHVECRCGAWEGSNLRELLDHRAKVHPPFYATLPCGLCPAQVGADGVFIDDKMKFCRACAARVKDVIEVPA